MALSICRCLLTWIEDGAGAASCCPGFRVEGDLSLLYFHLAILTEHLLNFDLYFCMGALVMG